MDTDTNTEIHDDYPVHYVSIRVTCPPEDWPALEAIVSKGTEWHLAYPHTGKTGLNPHFHIAIPGAKKDCMRVRAALNRSGYTHNKMISLKLMDNGLDKFIQYASKENTAPLYVQSHINMRRWIESSPKWSNANLRANLNPDSALGRRKREDPEGICITQSNFLRLCLAYHQEHDLKDNRLPQTLVHMFGNGYYLSPAFARGGMPDFYLTVFTDSVLSGKLEWGKCVTTWSTAIFRNFNRN